MFAVPLIEISNPEKAIREQEEVALFRERAAFELEKRTAFEKCATWGDELEWEVGCVALKSQKSEGLGVSVERSVQGSRNLGNKCMDRHKRRVFGVFRIGTVYEILEKKKIPRTTLNNSEKPVL